MVSHHAEIFCSPNICILYYKLNESMRMKMVYFQPNDTKKKKKIFFSNVIKVIFEGSNVINDKNPIDEILVKTAYK